MAVRKHNWLTVGVVVFALLLTSACRFLPSPRQEHGRIEVEETVPTVRSPTNPSADVTANMPEQTYESSTDAPTSPPVVAATDALDPTRHDPKTEYQFSSGRKFKRSDSEIYQG